MFDLCYECEKELKKCEGDVYGYWGENKIKFVGLTKYICENCDDFYLDESTAILTQEITRAFSDLDNCPEIVDITESYAVLALHLRDIYDIITNNKIHMVKKGNKIIINSKELNLLHNSSKLRIAARKNNGITKDVMNEINDILNHDD